LNGQTRDRTHRPVGRLGAYLTDSVGRTLYEFAADTGDLMIGRFVAVLHRREMLVAATAVAGAVVAACGSSSSGGGAGAAAAPTAASSSAVPSGGAARGATHDGPGTSTRTGQCATFWPRLTTSGPLASSAGVKASLLGTSPCSDGSTQVTYAGHPVYHFAEDKAAGDIKGQGSTGSGAKWWILSPDGSAITRTVSAAPATSSAGHAWS